MNIFIIFITIAVYALLIAWTWHNLGGIEKSKKVMIIAIGVLVIYLLTLFIFNISKQEIQYDNEELSTGIKNMLVSVFTGVNGIIVLPLLARLIDKINEDDIEKQSFLIRIFGIIVVFIICLVIECGYMKSTQQGILKIREMTNQGEVQMDANTD